MRAFRFLLAGLLCLTIFFCQVAPTQAARGIPGSPEFGYGARLDLDGRFVEDALEVAADLPLDWLAITLPWSEFNSQVGTSAAWKRLDGVMKFAADNHIAVMFSLTSAPSTAQTAQGPDAAQTARFVAPLARRYAGALQAVELFPDANTARGWGAAPNPQAYINVFATVQAALQSAGTPTLLIAGGLKPVPASSKGDMDDLAYLQGLYQSAGSLALPVISLDLSDPTGSPLSPADSGEPRLLRHYEDVRKVMATAGRSKDLIWVTSIRAPSGTISKSDSTYLDPHNQTTWLFQAYSQLRAQLFVGVTFYQSLNPAARSGGSGALILDNQEYHPFYSILRELIMQNPPGAAPPQRGRPKNEALDKRRT